MAQKRTHIIKAQENIIHLEAWLKNNPAASEGDIDAAKNMLADLRDASRRQRKYVPNIKLIKCVDELNNTIPEFIDVVEDNVAFTEGQILPYPIFGDLRKFFVKQLKGNNKELADRIQIFIENMLDSPNPRIRELAAFGFLENLESEANSNEEYEQLKQELNPRLIKELEEIDAWWYGENVDVP